MDAWIYGCMDVWMTHHQEDPPVAQDTVRLGNGLDCEVQGVPTHERIQHCLLRQGAGCIRDCSGAASGTAQGLHQGLLRGCTGATALSGAAQGPQR